MSFGYCSTCGGLIPEPDKAYGYGGKFCLCEDKEIDWKAEAQDQKKSYEFAVKLLGFWRREALAGRRWELARLQMHSGMNDIERGMHNQEYVAAEHLYISARKQTDDAGLT